MLLISILLLPLATGLVCLLVRSRPTLERLNLLAFAAGALLAGHLGARVIAAESVSALGGFLYADALSALVVGLTALVALASGIYSVGYLRRDAGAGRITATQVHRYYTLTPLFAFAMLLVTLANNLGVMWLAIEGTTLASVLLLLAFAIAVRTLAGNKS